MSFAILTDIRSGDILGVTHPGKGQRRGGCAVTSGNVRHTGLRYRCLLPASDLSCFPDSFRSLVNDESFEARAAFFSSWLHRRGLDIPGLLPTLTSSQALAMLGVFLQEVARGDNILGRDDISDDTI
jgi:hypothetical protein